MTPAPIDRLGAAPPRDEHAALRQACRQLQGSFTRQLVAAMRATVHADGALQPAPGQELFTSLLDDRFADLIAEHSAGGLGEALYRQLSRHLPPAPPGGHEG